MSKYYETVYQKRLIVMVQTTNLVYKVSANATSTIIYIKQFTVQILNLKESGIQEVWNVINKITQKLKHIY